MPSVQPGPYYPGVDKERTGILPDRVQFIKKGLLDIDVDDVRLDESVMCDVDQIFNTSAAPLRDEDEAAKAAQTHFCTPDPNAFKDVPPVEFDPNDLKDFDYDFDDSGDAKQPGGDAQGPASGADKEGAPTSGESAQRRNERVLTAEEEQEIQAAKDKIQIGLEDLPPDLRATMMEYLQDLGWNTQAQVTVPRDRYSGPITKSPAEMAGASGGPKTVCLSASGVHGLRGDDMGPDVGINPAHSFEGARVADGGGGSARGVDGADGKGADGKEDGAGGEASGAGGSGSAGKARPPAVVQLEPWEEETDEEWVGGWKAGHDSPGAERGGGQEPAKLSGEQGRQEGKGGGGGGDRGGREGGG